MSYKHHIQVTDRLGVIHDFYGDENLNFYCEGNNVRIYNPAENGSLAHFNNYTKVEWIKKEKKKYDKN